MAYQFPLEGGRINASVGGNSTSAGAGYSLVSTGTLLLAGGNNITLSQNGSAITISGANAPSGSINFSASNTSANLASVSFSNSNGVSFGLNAGVITASHNGITSQSAQTGNLYISSNSTQLSSTAGVDLRSLTFQGAGGASIGVSQGKVLVSVNSTYAASNHSHGNPSLNLTNISGTTASASNGLTLSLSAAAQSAQTQSVIQGIIASGSTNRTGDISFANSNGVTFGLSNNTVTASVAAAGGGVALYDGVNSISSGTARISAAGALTASVNGQTLSLSAPAVSSLSATGALSISNNAGTISIGAPAFSAGIASNSTVTNQFILTGGNNITLSQSTNATGATVSISAANQSVQTQNLHNMTLAGNTTGTLAQISSGTLTLAGGSNITLSQSGNAITIIGAASGGSASQSLYVNGDGAQTAGWRAEGGNYTNVDDQPTNDGDTTRLYSVGANDETSFTLDNTSGITTAVNSVTVHAVVKSLDPVSSTFQIFVRVSGTNYYSDTKDTVTDNTNYIDFTYAWSTNPATGLAWTTSDIDSLEVGVKKINTSGQRLTQMYAVVSYVSGSSSGLALANSQTTYSSGTVNLLAGGGAITIASTTGQKYNFSVPATSSLSVTGALSISRNGSTVSIGAPAFSAGISTIGNTSGTSGTASNQVIFAGGNNITLSQSTGAGGNTISIIGGAGGGGGGVALSANALISSGTASLSAAGALTASVNGQTLSLSVPAQSSLSVTGALSMSNNGSTISLGAPATSSLIGINGVSISTTGNSIYLSGPTPTLQRWEYPSAVFTTLPAIVNNSISLQHMYVPFFVTGTEMKIGGSLSIGTHTSASTGSVTIKYRMALYTLNGSTLSLATSGSGSTSFGVSSNSVSSLAGMRQFTVPMNVNMTPGQYWAAAMMSTATNYASNSMTFTLYGNNQMPTAASNAILSPMGVAVTAAPRDVYLFQGMYGTTTTAFPAAIQGSQINNSAASAAMRAQFYNAIYNATY